MNIQYRIAEIDGEFYPQARRKLFLFWSGWRKIEKHIGSYGLYPVKDLEYPKTHAECQDIIQGFDTWYKKKNTKNINYTPYIVRKNK